MLPPFHSTCGVAMKKRFSSNELFAVRNDIPIYRLIEHVFLMPCRTTDGILRFLCPLCSEFQTATKASTNLARCFRCQRNFNAIDLVMLVRQATFQESVAFLQRLLRKKTNSKRSPAIRLAAAVQTDSPTAGSLQSTAQILCSAGFLSKRTTKCP